jgi:hypothetical protein
MPFPKYSPNVLHGVASTLPNDAFLHRFCPNPDCNCSLQVSYYLGIVFIDIIF